MVDPRSPVVPVQQPGVELLHQKGRPVLRQDVVCAVDAVYTLLELLDRVRDDEEPADDLLQRAGVLHGLPNVVARVDEDNPVHPGDLIQADDLVDRPRLHQHGELAAIPAAQEGVCPVPQVEVGHPPAEGEVHHHALGVYAAQPIDDVMLLGAVQPVSRLIEPQRPVVVGEPLEEHNPVLDPDLAEHLLHYRVLGSHVSLRVPRGEDVGRGQLCPGRALVVRVAVADPQEDRLPILERVIDHDLLAGHVPLDQDLVRLRERQRALDRRAELFEPVAHPDAPGSAAVYRLHDKREPPVPQLLDVVQPA